MKVKDLAIGFIGTVIRLAVVAIAILMIFNVGKKAYDFGYRIFTEEPMDEEPGRDVIVTIKDSDNIVDISKMLEEKGLCSDWLLFVIQSKLSEYKEDPIPGTYTLNTSMTTDTMLMTMEGIEMETAEGDEKIDASEAEELSESSLDNILSEEGDTYLGTEEGTVEGEDLAPEGEAAEGEAAGQKEAEGAGDSKKAGEESAN
ncbi:MAG: endolytic transglycosylase MltG [Lachnospiraceae bacterium]|nr:endolytic transglycosylase MltG [Lachnospiraceae bacterium]